MNKSPRVSLGLILLLGAALVPAGPIAPAEPAYAAVNSYPKPPATTAIIVLDMQEDTGSTASWAATEAMLASTAIQGIVNSQSSTKIYFLNGPKESFWTTFPTEQYMLADNIVPSAVTRTYPTVDDTKTYPVLSYLLANFSSYIDGKVLYPAMSSTVVPGTISAAITAAGATDSVPVSPGIESYVTAAGLSLTTTANTRSFTSNIDAHDYAVDNFLSSSTTVAYAGVYCSDAFGGESQPGRQVPNLVDYFIATTAFVTCLNGEVPAEASALTDFLSTAYPVGTPVLGMPHDENPTMGAIEAAGDYLVIAANSNISVLSSFPSNSTDLNTPSAPSAAPIDPDGAYVAFYQTDGDNISSLHHHYNYWRSSATAGDVPMGWSVNPALFDLMPTVLQWRSNNNYDDTYEEVVKFSNGGGPSAPAARTDYLGDLQHYLSNSNGLYSSMNYLGLTIADIPAALDIDLLMQGYQGATDGNSVTWTQTDDTTVTGFSGCTQSCASATEVFNAARYVADETPDGVPSFVIVPVGAGWEDGTAAASAAQDLLLASPNGRTYHFMTPRDLAATWRAWMSTQGTATYEAEDAVLSGGAGVNDDHAGYTGSGFVDGYWQTGATTTFSVVAAAAGTQDVTVRYSSGDGTSGARTIAVEVNGTKVTDASLPKTADWDAWTEHTIPLTLLAGANTISLVQESGSYGNAINIDHIEMDLPTTYEAESGTLSGGALAASDHAGYTGSGFVAGFWQTGAKVTVDVASSGGSTPIELRYSSGDGASGNRAIAVQVDGVTVSTLSLPKTADWATWTTATFSLTLPAGASSISFLQESGSYGNAVNIDHLVLP